MQVARRRRFLIVVWAPDARNGRMRVHLRRWNLRLKRIRTKYRIGLSSVQLLRRHDFFLVVLAARLVQTRLLLTRFPLGRRRAVHILSTRVAAQLMS